MKPRAQTIAVSFDGRIVEFYCRFRASEFVTAHQGAYIV